MRVVALTDRTIGERFGEFKEGEFWDEVAEKTRRMATALVQGALEEELLQRLDASRYQRTETRQGYRNGSYDRTLSSRWGILDLKVPRARKAPPGDATSVLERFARREPEVEALIRNVFLKGVSTREVGPLLERIVGEQVSAQTVSRIVQQLDQEVRRFHWRLLDDDWLYLFLDGVTMTVREAAGAVTKLVLVAYGVRPDGTRQLIDYRLASSESYPQWEAFLNDLAHRGLVGTRLALIITDGCPGLHRAIEMIYPRVLRQACWVHKLRNVEELVPSKHRELCRRQLAAVYRAPTETKARQAFRRWRDTWQGSAPKAVASVARNLEELLAFYQVPPAHRQLVRTTNHIERAFREVRRRTRPMSCFTNTRSCDRIIYAVITNINRRWQDKPLKPFTQNS
jgi:putative transposase